MLTELRVRELGVIADLEVALRPGLTVITGETGAGKTLVIEALELLVGGRADPSMVRSGATEARIEGRFVDDDDEETVIARTVPAEGRSRASVNGQMVTVGSLEELAERLVDLYGQHAHQSLLRPLRQRQALDRFARVDLSEVLDARRAITELDTRLAELGGDERSVAREIDLLRFELGEIEQAAIGSPEEDDELAAEEDRLANALALQEAATGAYQALEHEEGGALSALASAIDALGKDELFAAARDRLRGLLAELGDAALELRRDAESLEPDPERLEVVRARRELLRRLMRKHGEQLADVLVTAQSLGSRLEELEGRSELRGRLAIERSAALVRLEQAENRVGDLRRAAAAPLADEVVQHLRRLALRSAELSVSVPAKGIGDEVEFLISTNVGEGLRPLAKVASGGELARAMLALRLVLSSAPPTLVFDEVDAGIGGEAALAVGAALAALGVARQVLVVTHLAQVAAYGDQHLVVEKSDEGGRTVTRLTEVEGEGRIVELSRMLSGHPDSEAARVHASELLEASARGSGTR